MAIPAWLSGLAVFWLLLCGLCAVGLAIDVLRRGGLKPWIMGLVWPLTALYAGPIAVAAYLARRSSGDERPLWRSAALGATHCGSGCTLGDLVAEWFVFFVPITLFGHHIFGSWVIDYIAAFGFGIAFQYFTIRPMREGTRRSALKAAVKADTASLTAWQVGMYGWMAIVTFAIFGEELSKTSPTFWFMMQIAMLAGFLTSYPVNIWLIRQGIKEAM